MRIQKDKTREPEEQGWAMRSKVILNPAEYQARSHDAGYR